MKKISLVLFIILLINSLFAASHPYMLVKESEYDSLRNKADEYPWSEFINQATEAVEHLEYKENFGLLRLYDITTDLAGALALCYIIYPDKRESYISKFETDVYKLIDAVRLRKENSDDPPEHGYNVGPSQAAFMVYLALDIMFDDINIVIRKEIEADVEYIALNHYPHWEESKYAIEGMDALYKYGPNSVIFKEKAQKYFDFLLSAASEDGVYTTGPGYVYSRLYMNRRVQKKVFIDVCEYQGINNFYSNPEFINLYEWIFGYSVTPFNKTYTFGDSPPVKSFDEWSTSALRANRFSETAGNYAAWYLGPPVKLTFQNTLINFLLTDKLPSQAKKPETRIFPNGGAWLIGNGISNSNLSGVLWNINTSEESHSHYDVNSINIAGYGEFLIRNSGYDNWKSPDRETWNWLHRNAESSNTITINKKNHLSFRGGGITKSITGYDIAYAEGESGDAIPNGKHVRSLVSVKSSNNLPGYFILFDEVTIDSINSAVDIYLHPNSDTEPQVTKDNVYRFKIKNCDNLSDDLYLNIMINDKPDNINIKNGYRGSYEECSRYVGKYIDAEYSTGTSNFMDAAFILFPNRNIESVPAINKIENENYNITSLTYNTGVVDYVINPARKNEIMFDKTELKASAVYLRKVEVNNLNIWCRNGTKFINNDNDKIGFESNDEITFVLVGKKGEIISGDSDVRIYFPSITAVKIDSKLIPNSETGNNWIDITLEKGNHKFDIISTVEINTSNDVLYYLSSNEEPVTGKFARIDYSISKIDNVKITIFNSDDKQVDVILDEEKEAGTYSIFYNTDILQNGEYFYEMATSVNKIKNKMVITK